MNNVYHYGNQDVPGGATSMQGDVEFYGNGNIASATGATFFVNNNGGSTVTTASGLELAINNTGSGSIGTAYGLFIHPIAGTAAWSIYASDTNAPSYFGASVGIGTALPQAGLDIATVGTARSAMIVPRDTSTNRPAGVNGMLRYNTSANAFEFFQNNAWVSYNTSAAGAVNFPLLASPAVSSASAPSYSFSGNANTGLFSPASSQLALAANGTVALTISSAGNVGIGTTTPQTSLDVNGGIRPGSSAVVSSACASATEGIQRYNYSSHALEICNATSWLQVPLMNAGTTIPVTASGLPVSANIYAFASAVANTSLDFGSAGNLINGNWPANGTNVQSNGGCAGINRSSSTNYVTLDLGATKTINNVYISLSDSSVYTVAGIAFSNDNVTFTSSTTIGNLPATYGSDSAIYMAAASVLRLPRYVRLSNSATNGSNGEDSFRQLAVGP